MDKLEVLVLLFWVSVNLIAISLAFTFFGPIGPLSGGLGLFRFITNDIPNVMKDYKEKNEKQ